MILDEVAPKKVKECVVSVLSESAVNEVTYNSSLGLRYCPISSPIRENDPSAVLVQLSPDLGDILFYRLDSWHRGTAVKKGEVRFVVLMV